MDEMPPEPNNRNIAAAQNMNVPEEEKEKKKNFPLHVKIQDINIPAEEKEKTDAEMNVPIGNETSNRITTVNTNIRGHSLSYASRDAINLNERMMKVSAAGLKQEINRIRNDEEADEVFKARWIPLLEATLIRRKQFDERQMQSNSFPKDVSTPFITTAASKGLVDEEKVEKDYVFLQTRQSRERASQKSATIINNSSNKHKLQRDQDQDQDYHYHHHQESERQERRKKLRAMLDKIRGHLRQIENNNNSSSSSKNDDSEDSAAIKLGNKKSKLGEFEVEPEPKPRHKNEDEDEDEDEDGDDHHAPVLFHILHVKQQGDDNQSWVEIVKKSRKDGAPKEQQQQRQQQQQQQQADCDAEWEVISLPP